VVAAITEVTGGLAPGSFDEILDFVIISYDDCDPRR
jgi:hypothetical protein